MTVKWLRQDPAVRKLPLSLIIIGPLVMSALLGVFAWQAAAAARAAGMGPGSWSISSFTMWACLFWLAVGFFFFAPGCRERCSHLSMALPLSARKLWLYHLCAVFVSGITIILVAAGIVVLKACLLIYVFDGPDIFKPDIARLAVHLSAGLALAAVLLQSPKPSLRTIPLSKGYVTYLVTTLAGVLGLMLLLGQRPLFLAFVPLSMAMVLGIRTYRSLPTTFTLVPFEAEEAARIEERREPEECARPVRGFAYDWFLHRIVWRSLYGKWLLWFWLLFVFVAPLGILLSGIILTESGYLYQMRFMFIPLAVYMLLAFIVMPLRNLYRLDPLPISRRRLFAVSFAPSLVILCIGYGVGKIWGGMAEPRELISYRADPDSHYYLYVPIGANEIAWDGEAPKSTSPWGESHEAWSAPLYEGSVAAVYSPYHTPVGSSMDFVALQISRATEAVYSETVPPEEIKNRYLEVNEDGKVVLMGQALTLRADYPHLRPRNDGPFFPVILVLVGLPWMILISAYLRAYRAELSPRARRVVLFATLFLLMAAYLGLFALFVMRFTRSWTITGVIEILIRQVSEVPGGTPAIWVLAAILLYAGYRWAESRFHRIEVPASPDRLPVWEAFANS